MLASTAAEIEECNALASNLTDTFTHPSQSHSFPQTKNYNNLTFAWHKEEEATRCCYS